MEQEPIVIEPSPEKTQVFPPVKKKRSGCFCCLFGCFGIFVVLLILLLAAVWTFNGSIAVWSERLKGDDTEEEDEFVIERGMTRGKIAVIDVCGVILNENGGYSENADSSLICRQLKKAEKEECRVIRLVETAGRFSKARLHTEAELVETDLLEWNDGAHLKPTGGSIELEFRPFQIRTFKLRGE